MKYEQELIYAVLVFTACVLLTVPVAIEGAIKGLQELWGITNDL